jgi:hypothetical protein
MAQDGAEELVRGGGDGRVRVQRVQQRQRGGSLQHVALHKHIGTLRIQPHPKGFQK